MRVNPALQTLGREEGQRTAARFSRERGRTKVARWKETPSVMLEASEEGGGNAQLVAATQMEAEFATVGHPEVEQFRTQLLPGGEKELDGSWRSVFGERTHQTW